MSGLINLFVRRPVTVIMILAALIIAAIFSLINLPVNNLPDISVPRVTVETVYQGMAASEIRSLVTIPLEDGLSAVKSLERIRSISRDNRSVISMDFRWGIDPVTASTLVREAVDAVYPSLPEGVQKPTVSADNSTNEPHVIVAVMSHNGNAQYERKLAEYEIKARLRKIDGVGSVILVGGEVNEQRLNLDVPRLAALGLSPSEFAGLLAQETADIPAGNARDGNTELVIVSSGRPETVNDLSKIILPLTNGSLRAEDAGLLQPSSARQESLFIYNGVEATALEVYRRPGADPIKLSKEINKTITEAAKLFSRDVEIQIVNDSTPSLVKGIIVLVISAALAAIAVFCVLLLFIRRLKYSLLASLSIPFSIAAGICALSVTGRSLNSMSLGGLAMGIGLVSDISVIVLDLLHRSFGKRQSSPSPHEISEKIYSIIGSSAASTLTTAMVFLPVILLPGVLGSLFGDLAISLVASVTAGWFYAQFCLPSLFRLLFSVRIAPNINNKLLNCKVFTDGSLNKKYVYYLSFLLRKPHKAYFAAFILVILGTLCLLTRTTGFINPDEAEEVRVSIITPPGTLLESLSETGKILSNKIGGLPFVNIVFGRAGAEEEDVGHRADINYRKEELILRCVLEQGIKPLNALAEINDLFKYSSPELPAHTEISVYLPKDKTENLLGLSSQRVFAIKGNDREEVLDRKLIAEDLFENDKTEVFFKPLGQRPEIRVFPNREAAAFLSVSAAQIAENLYILNEGVIASRLEIEGRPLDVRVTGQRINSYNLISSLEQIPLRTAQGRIAYLGSLSRIEQKEAEASLARLDRSDVIYAETEEAKKIPKSFKEAAHKFSWFTQADESVFNRYRNSLLFYVLLVLILLYMTMGAQFESFLLPLILMLTIPFSIAGAGPALLFSRSMIDSGAVLGLTALFGLVVNNSLILFEISEEKIRNGFSAAIAVYSGACERLQAILITTATTVFALMPLVISPMGNSQKSMAAAMLGGLAASSLLSLFVIPSVLIRYFNWKIKKEEETK